MSEPTSEPVLRRLNAASSRLDALLTSLSVYSRADSSLRAIAAGVAAAAAHAPDVAIAAIVLNQVGGRYAIRHCVDSAALATLVARRLGHDEASIATTAAAALTMNVGMLREIDSLHARASVLSAAERERIRRHPVDGAELLRCAGIDDQDWIDCVLQHHEAADGSGYPHGLVTEQIAAGAALVGMADRYCACIGARNYRRSMLPPAALDRLVEENAGHPELVRGFVAVLGAYPPGTLVRFDDDALGVVATPATVRVLRSAASDDGDQWRPHTAIRAALHEADARLRFSMTSVWGELAAL
ncbi:MAG: hypothetical protein JWP59_2053 [Massilia sp.]|nr:hypothetical protein [Massilia sp.]